MRGERRAKYSSMRKWDGSASLVALHGVAMGDEDMIEGIDMVYQDLNSFCYFTPQSSTYPPRSLARPRSPRGVTKGKAPYPQ